MLFTVAGTSTTPAIAHDAVGSMFGSLYGKWKGKGVIVPSAGKPAENISCRAIYTRQSNTVLNVHIRCAAVDFKIDAEGKISYSNISKMFRGSLADHGTGWTLTLAGGQPKKQRIRFGLRIPEADVNGWMDFIIKSNRSHSWFAQRATSAGLKQLLRIDFRR